MRTKNFLLVLSCLITASLFVIIFGQNKPDSIQNFVTTTNKQIKNLKDNLYELQRKQLKADEKYLNLLDCTDSPRLYPNYVWKNTSLPVIVTYVRNGQESQAIGLINNVAKVLPNNTILVYNLGLRDYSVKTLLSYCNSSRCQIVSFELSDYPSHVDDDSLHAYRPLVIQDALSKTGAVFFLECNFRLQRHVTHTTLTNLFESKVKKTGILAWPKNFKNPVSSFTHKKMFDYFHTEADNFLFLQMINADILMIANTKSIHYDVMLPWVQCSLVQDCIVPIGAQSAGCRYDKKPLYRYSGCHSYDTSALNIALGLKFKFDNSEYTSNTDLFDSVTLNKANDILKELEQNATTEGKLFSVFSNDSS